MKILKWIAWISAGVGLIALLLAPISYLFNGGNALVGLHIVNFFHVASTFFLITIALFIYVYRCECKK